MKQENKKSVKKLTAVAMLTALATALQYIEFPIPIMPPFIKLDFSDLPELVGAVMFGPMAGILIALLKNLIHFLASSSGFIGEISNFALGAVFAGGAGLLYSILSGRPIFIKKKGEDGPTAEAYTFKSRISPAAAAVAAGAIGAVLSGIAALPLNVFIIYPLYYSVMGLEKQMILEMYQALIPGIKSIAQAVLVFNVPFTIVKNLISVAITAVLFKPLSRVQKML